MTETAVPDDLRYTTEHEWVAVGAAGTVRFGITDHAQSALGDVVFVTLPTVGTTVQAGEPCGEVESTKSVSDIYAPVTGTVLACNPVLDAAPETVNADPYGAGWMVELAVDDVAVVDELLDALSYRLSIGEG
ncbi:MAG: glycine cleavage system protein GcvH [Actinomycetota bacterium]|nr:MAG: glycine cleavage system protein GcvH [Actinomycetota bacterium]